MITEENSISNILDGLKTLHIPARTIIVHEGMTAPQLYFVRTGAIRIWLNKGGKDITLQFFFEGEGATVLESFLYGEQSPFSIETIEACKLSVLPRETFSQWIADNTAFKDWFYQTAVQKQLQHSKRLLSLITRTPAQRYGDLMKDRPELLQRVPQQYIASYLGITPESLSRIRARRTGTVS